MQTRDMSTHTVQQKIYKGLLAKGCDPEVSNHTAWLVAYELVCSDAQLERCAPPSTPEEVEAARAYMTYTRDVTREKYKRHVTDTLRSTRPGLWVPKEMRAK